MRNRKYRHRYTNNPFTFASRFSSYDSNFPLIALFFSMCPKLRKQLFVHSGAFLIHVLAYKHSSEIIFKNISFQVNVKHERNISVSLHVNDIL